MTTACRIALDVHPVAEGLPDADIDVIVFLDTGESTLGALDATGWVDCTGMAFAEYPARVVAWADFPEAPPL